MEPTLFDGIFDNKARFGTFTKCMGKTLEEMKAWVETEIEAHGPKAEIVFSFLPEALDFPPEKFYAWVNVVVPPTEHDVKLDRMRIQIESGVHKSHNNG